MTPIYLAEIFYSLQGEGRYAGHPSLFLRFGGCNMSCPGLPCDTPYALSFSKEWMRFDDGAHLWEYTKEYIDGLSLPFRPMITLTGGEPCLQFGSTDFHPFLEMAFKAGFSVAVETNGAIKIEFEKFPFCKKLIYAVSVKLSGSGEPKEKRINESALDAIFESGAEAFFKFALSVDEINSGSATLEIAELKAEFPDVAVCCMPVAASKEELLSAAPTVWEFCKQHGYIYSDRLHIRLGFK